MWYTIGEMPEKGSQVYDQIFQSTQRCVSDLTPNMIQVWYNSDRQLRFSNIGGIGILRYNDPLATGSPARTTIVGVDANLKSITHAVLNSMEAAQESKPELYGVPENVAQGLMDDEELIVEVDPSSSDYLFTPSQQVLQAQLRGSKRGSLLRRFERKNLDLTFTVHGLPDSAASDEMLAAYQSWKSASVTTRNDTLDIESVIMRRHVSLRNLPSPPHMMVLRSNGVPIAFGIYHVPLGFRRKVACLHHLKADYRRSEVLEYFFHQVMEHMVKLGVETVNGESDLGVEGMRNFKTRLGPSGYERTYTISKR